MGPIIEPPISQCQGIWLNRPIPRTSHNTLSAVRTVRTRASPISLAATGIVPNVQWTGAQAWLEAREAELLPVPYVPSSSPYRPRSARSPTKTGQGLRPAFYGRGGDADHHRCRFKHPGADIAVGWTVGCRRPGRELGSRPLALTVSRRVPCRPMLYRGHEIGLHAIPVRVFADGATYRPLLWMS